MSSLKMDPGTDNISTLFKEIRAEDQGVQRIKGINRGFYSFLEWGIRNKNLY